MTRTPRLLTGAIVFALALSACGSDKKATPSDKGTTTTAADGKPAKLEGKVSLAVNPWDGSAANAAVAEVILERQGVEVEIKAIDENAAWVGLDDGSIGANLEVWPSGHAKDIDTYVTKKKSVVDGGPIGPTGHIGWYIPKYVADAHPEFATVDGLKTDAAAKFFKTAETGDQGQFLLGDPSYVSYDADIIKNLKLPFKVVTGGGEAALITAIDAAFKDKAPLLFYFYEPQWAQNKYELVSVKLPEITDECNASAAEQGKDGKYACDYPNDKLMKAISAKLQADNPAIAAFLTKMTWTSKDQNAVTTYKNEDGMTIEEAATKWVDANEATWKAWLG